MLQVRLRGDPETSPAVETAIGAEHVAMRVEALGKVSERLDGNDRTGESGGFGNCGFEEAPQGIPTTSAVIVTAILEQRKCARELLDDRTKSLPSTVLNRMVQVLAFCQWQIVPYNQEQQVVGKRHLFLNLLVCHKAPDPTPIRQ